MADLIKREDLTDVIDGLEVYTVGRMNIEKVQITVLQLQRFINALKNIPTAYDVEAVVAELEASAEGAKDSKDLSKWSAYQTAIEIVRNGGCVAPSGKE